MSGFRYHPLESDLEFEIASAPSPAREKHHVQIVSNGGRKLIFIDGLMLSHVLDINVPLGIGEISPQVTIKFHPERVTLRDVGNAEFKAMQQKGEPL